MTDLELIQRLSIYEDNFETAIKSGYTRNITRKNLEIIRDTYNAYTKHNHKPCLQCGSAIVQLLKDVGGIYFDVKNKIEQEKIEIVENDQSSTAREIVAGEIEQVNREVENEESDSTKKKRTKRSNETKRKSDKKK